MNSPNYPPPGGPQEPYGSPQGQPYGQRPPQTPPGGQFYGGQPPQTPPGGQSYGGQPPQTPPGGQSYGGPPPQGQPYGGPGGPSGPGGTPPVGYATPPPPPPGAKPKNTGKIIKIVLGVGVVVAIAIVAIVNWGTAPSTSKVGDCIKVNSVSTTDADVEKIDCNSKEAAYKVAATFDDSSAKCPGGTESDYVSYTESGRGDLTLCLTLNAKEGDCFEQADADRRVECTDPKATFKIIKILTDTSDGASCPEESQGNFYSYTDPDMVQCMGLPAEEGGA
ncbi:MAG: hypothetical protein WBA97_18620 [Actinophytocola sp.]|uniref:LppU/SCO3897 family protein n=1 Tax=Actinophytocola sp. TaxID=1872138 RepID=UPI003C72B100